MRFEHCRIVHLIDVVAGENEHVLGIVLLHEREVLIDRIRRSLKPRRLLLRLIRRQNMYAAERAVKIPRLTVSDILVEFERLVLREHAHRIDPRIDAVAQRKIDDTILSAERDCGLRNVVCKRVQTAPLTARKQHCHTFLLSLHITRTPCKTPLSYFGVSAAESVISSYSL